MEWLAVLLAEEVDDDTVFPGCRTIGVFVGNTLLAQDLQGLVHFRARHFENRTLDFRGRHVGRGEFRIHLENGREFEMGGAFGALRLDPRVAGDTHFLGGDGFAEDTVEFLGQDLVARLVAMLLPDDAERHLARAEARHLHVLAHALQALVHFLLDIGDGDGEVDAALEFVSLSSSCFHENSL